MLLYLSGTVLSESGSHEPVIARLNVSRCEYDLNDRPTLTQSTTEFWNIWLQSDRQIWQSLVCKANLGSVLPPLFLWRPLGSASAIRFYHLIIRISFTAQSSARMVCYAASSALEILQHVRSPSFSLNVPACSRGFSLRRKMVLLERCLLRLVLRLLVRFPKLEVLTGWVVSLSLWIRLVPMTPIFMVPLSVAEVEFHLSLVNPSQSILQSWRCGSFIFCCCAQRAGVKRSWNPDRNLSYGREYTTHIAIHEKRCGKYVNGGIVGGTCTYSCFQISNICRQYHYSFKF